MKSGITYTLTKNEQVVSEKHNKIHTSYFSVAPRSTYYAQIGSGTSELPFEAENLESFEIKVGNVTHNNLTRSTSQSNDGVIYSFYYSWGGVDPNFIGGVCEVGVGYGSSSTNFSMISRARFTDENNEPLLIKVEEVDTLGIKVRMELFKSTSSKPVSFEISEGRIITGKAYEVNLRNWFSDYIAAPLPSGLSMSLFNSSNLNIDSNNYNDLSGTIGLVKSTGTSKDTVSGADNRTDKFSSYFAPSNDYEFTHIGLYDGGSTTPANYFIIVVLDEPVIITEIDEFSITINVEQTEADINGNT